jgi:hypothetical protein
MLRPLLLAAAFVSGLTPALFGAEQGFRPIFNGRNLDGWEGDKRFWSVRDGAIRGETALGVTTMENTFLIWKGEPVGDFQLKLKVRLRNGNSGIQYRARKIRPWVVTGYQAEIENGAGKSGFLYEEQGRKFLALVGEKVEIDALGKPTVPGQIAPKKQLLAQDYYKPREWNDYLISAKGNHIEHYINGQKIVDVTDNDLAHRALEGVLALQIHVGPPMLVEFKDILLQTQ